MKTGLALTVATPVIRFPVQPLTKMLTTLAAMMDKMRMECVMVLRFDGCFIALGISAVPVLGAGRKCSACKESLGAGSPANFFANVSIGFANGVLQGVDVRL